MRVLVTGAYGLVGSAILTRLHRDGHEVVGAGRTIAVARRQFPFARWVVADFDRLTTAEAWRPLLAGVEAVVNCVGALQDGPRDDLRRVHVDAPAALFAACEEGGPRRVIHISAIGAALDGASRFATTKAEAEARLAASSLDWLILRPGVVLSAGVYGASALLRGLAAFPFVTPQIAGAGPVQIVSADDVAATVSAALSAADDLVGTLDLVHPQILSAAEIVAAYRRWLGLPGRRAVVVPRFIARAIAGIADGLGWLGWRSPTRSTGLAQLSRGVVGNAKPWMEATGIRPQSLAQILDARPSTVQDRWFARFYLLKPIALLTIAAFWVATGLIALGPGFSASRAYLGEGGFSAGIAGFTVIAGAFFDIVLGLLVLHRATARAALLTMLAVTPFYLIIGTLIEPTLWIDPLGAFTKVLPLLLATAFAVAILDER